MLLCSLWDAEKIQYLKISIKTGCFKEIRPQLPEKCMDSVSAYSPIMAEKRDYTYFLICSS